MELETAHDHISSTRRTKRGLLSSQQPNTESKNAASVQQRKLEMLLQELAEVIEAEDGILTP